MDPISDMLTRIRNAYRAKKAEVAMPYSNFKNNLAAVLVKEGWIKAVQTKDQAGMKILVVELKYSSGEPAIVDIQRVSKPGQRIYAKNTEIPKVMGGFGTTIVSTSKGLMTDKLARKQKLGGEVICQVW